MQPLVDGHDALMLRLHARADGAYVAQASTRAAEAVSEFALPFSELELENFILRVSRPRGRRRIDHSALGEARRFGAALFNALFRGDVETLYRDALAEARRRGRGVRITLCLSKSPELIDVPWEYLFDEPDFLAVSAFTPVVRYLDRPPTYRPLRVEAPLRVLGVVSSPAEYERLDVERERDNLTRALSDSIDAGAVELHWLEQPTLGALLRALQADPFHVLHYIGHGAYDREAERGVLLFEDEGGWARPVSGDKLGMILHDFWSLRLVVLNACEGARTGRSDPFAGVAGALVQRDIPAVVAMQFEISDEAAIIFAGGFYRPLAAGLPVDTSLAAARLAILAERGDDIEWGTPVLFMRVPDGRIFASDDEDGSAEAGPILAAVGAAHSGPREADDGPLATAQAKLTVAAPTRGDLPSDPQIPESTTRASQVAQPPPGEHRSWRPLLGVVALAALLAAVVSAIAIGGGGAAAHRAALTARAGPFTIAYRGPWRSVTGAVPGAFAVRGAAGGGATGHAARSSGQPVQLVAGQASLAAGQLIASAPIPGGAPPALVDRYGRPRGPVDVPVAGHRGREYTWSSGGGRVIAYVLATPTGDGAIICQAPTTAAASLRACGALAAGAHIGTTPTLPPGPDRGLARAITGTLQAVNAARAKVGRLRGPLAARRQAAATLSRAEANAAGSLDKLAPPPRYREDVARMTRAVSHEAEAFAALARAAGAGQRHAYVSAVAKISAASRALAAATRRLQVDRLSALALGALHLAGPPPAPAPAQVVTSASPSSSSSGATSGATSGSSSPPPSATPGSGAGTSTTYVTPFS